MRVTEAEAGWLAGILDGEGCFSARLLGSHKRNFGLQLFIGSSDWRILERLKTLLNKITGQRIVARANKCSPDAYIVALYNKPAFKALIPVVLKYLTVKKAQAALFYELARRPFNTHGVPEWAVEYTRRIIWFNSHRQRPDGTMVPTAREKIRQSRGKPPISGVEPVETIQGTAKAEEIVQEGGEG